MKTIIMKTILLLFWSIVLFSCIDYNWTEPVDDNVNSDPNNNNNTDNTGVYIFDFSKDIDLIIYNQLGTPYRDDNFGVNLNKWGKHEGSLPIKYADWGNGSYPQQWMSPDGKKALSSWGQIVEDKNGSPLKDVSFQIRNHKMYIHYNNTWVLAENVIDNIEFGIFEKSDYSFITLLNNNAFQKNNNIVTIPYQSVNFLHWFTKQDPVNRYMLPASYDAIFLTCEIKLISNSNSDNSKYKFLAAVGADYYANYNTINDGNKGLVMPRHKYITNEWKTFTAYIAGAVYPLSEWDFKTEISKRPLPPMH